MGYLIPLKWRIFGLTYLAYSILYVTRKSFSVVKTVVQTDLNLSSYDLGMIDTSFLSSYALFQIFLPSASDVIGGRPVVIACFFGSAVFSVMFGLSTSAAQLNGCWLLEGLCHASVFAVFVQYVSNWFSPDDRQIILGFWTTSQQIGSILSTALVTFINTRYGWRVSFIVAGILTALTAILIYLFLVEPPFVLLEKEKSDIELSTRRRHVKEGGGSLSGGEFSIDEDEQQPISCRTLSGPISPTNNLKSSLEPLRFFDLLKIPGLIPCGLAYFCIKLVRYAMLFWLPFYLVTARQFTPATAGLCTMVFDLGGIFGAVLSGILVGRLFKGHKLIAISIQCLATAIPLIMMSTWFSHNAAEQQLFLVSEDGVEFANSRIEGVNRYQDTVFITFLLIGITGVLIAGPDSLLGASAASYVCERYGSPRAQLSLGGANGIVNGLGAIGGVAQGYLIAIVSEHFGWNLLFFILGIICLTGACTLIPFIVRDVGAIKPAA